MAPARMESRGSGMTFFRSISSTSPKPPHSGQAPLGELNEKVFGSGSGNDWPDSGHIKWRE